ncbi:MAG: DUF3553 domain-containing protein [Pseudomonadota bacterium]
MHELLEPGARVRLKGAPDWGVGQVQSVIGDRVTINFENAGKRVIDASRAVLEPVFEP